MKKQIIAVILLACLTFVGCSNEDKAESTTESTTKSNMAVSTEKKVYSKTDYADSLTNELNSGSFELKLKSEAGCYSVDNISVGSIETSEDGDGYDFTVYGKFYAYNKYGSLDDIYQYRAKFYTSEFSATVILSDVSVF